MKCVSVLLVLGICTSWGSTQFLNHRPYPTYSLENMPSTEFSCRDKILGGYYADVQTECQMFHICVKVAGVGIQDFRFLCPNGTAFDQDHQICADWEDVDCDPATLYYSSDNFDLYRLGSGFESKAVKYGEDEETFALQRAETGDARLNRQHQSNSVNQQREIKDNYNRNTQPKQNTNNNNNNNNNSERDIFKGSSSSNFFNNRNNGKEKDEDYDDNVNVNQNRDNEQKQKTRVKQRRPVQSRGQKRIQNNGYNSNRDTDSYAANTEKSTTFEAQTKKPTSRPTTFVNNFAGSSYVPTTSRPSSTTINNEQYTTAVNNYRSRNGQRQRPQQYDEDDSARQPATKTSPPPPPPSTSYAASSTPVPFRQTQQYNTPPNRHPSTQNNNNNGQYYTTTQVPKRDTEIYSQTKSKQTTPYDNEYDTPKIKSTKAENYQSSSPNYSQQYDVPKKTTPFSKTENYPSNNPKYFDKKPTTPIRQTETYPTTFPPKPKPFSVSSQSTTSFPTTFAPRTNTGFSQIVQQTEQYSKPSSTSQQFTQKSTAQFNPTTFSQQYNSSPSTPKTTSAQYTPTVPKISSTTPVSRSNRFDETQYDDGSYSDKEDEFLRTAHSQNIAASRNELAKTTKQQFTQTTPQFDTPRPFSVSTNTSKVTETTNAPRITYPPKETESPRTTATLSSSTRGSTGFQSTRDTTYPIPETSSKKKTKDASYDYAYYDSNPNSEPEYDIDTEFKKSTIRD